MRAACYIRVSSEEQAREGISLAMQEERLRQRVEADGIPYVAYYRDDGYSAASLDRPQVQEMLDDLPNIDIVYVWKLDRLTRSQRDFHWLLEVFAETKTGVVSLSEHFAIDEAIGKLIASVLAAVGEFQLDWMGENIVAALQHRVVEQGLQHGTPPIGYAYPTDAAGESLPGAPMEPVPEQVNIVRRCFDMYAEDAASLREIVRVARGEEWPSYGRGAKWSTARVRYMLTNPVYVGRVVYRGEEFDGAHEAIIDAATFETVQRRLSRRSGGGGPTRQTTTYASLLRCGLCGGHVAFVRDPNGYGRYRCAERDQVPREDRHPTIGCPGDMADTIIDEWTRHLLDDDVLAEAVAMVAAELSEDRGDDLTEIDREMAEIDEQIAYYHRAASRGTLPEDMLDDQLRPLLSRRDSLQATRRALAREPHKLPPWLSEQADFDVLWDRPFHEQVEMLMDLYERVELYGSHLVIHHRGPFPARHVRIPRYVSDDDRQSAARDALGID